MQIELTEDEVHEILRSWFRLKMPAMADAVVAVRQLHYEGSLAAAIEVSTAVKNETC